MQVLPALAYVHQQGVAHGDLQLRQLLLHSSGCIKLSGFNSAVQPAEDNLRSKDLW
jgi:serine/threonine protein kinase